MRIRQPTGVDMETAERALQMLLDTDVAEDPETAERLLELSRVFLGMDESERLDFLQEYEDRYEPESPLFRTIEASGHLSPDRMMPFHEAILTNTRSGILRQRSVELLSGLVRHMPEHTAELMIIALEDDDPEVSELAAEAIVQLERQLEDSPDESLREFVEALAERLETSL